MAAKTDIVRISYNELENIVHGKTEKSSAHQGKLVKEDDPANRLDKKKERRQKRPTRGVYQPPSILRHKQQLEQAGGGNWNGEAEGETQGECWEEELDVESHGSATNSSKENSVEKEIDEVLSNIRNLQVQSEDGLASTADSKKRSKTGKRPEIQRYVPKGKLIEQSQKDSESEEVDDSSRIPPVNQSAGTPSHLEDNTSPRKIDLGKSSHMDVKITFVNQTSSAQGSKSDQVPATPQRAGSESRLVGGHGELQTTGGQRLRSTGVQEDYQMQNRHKNDNHGQKFTRDRHQGQRGQVMVEKGGKRVGGFGRGQNREEGYGTWPREKGGGRGNSPKENSPPCAENWDIELRIVEKGDIDQKEDKRNQNTSQASSTIITGSEPPKPQRINQRRPRDRPVKQTTVSIINAPDEPEDASGNHIPTMIFERRNSNSSITGSIQGSNENLKQKPPKGQISAKGPPKRYSLSTMRRQRTGSVSSDVSTASDLSIDDETTTRILDWDKEVEREMAKQVQDETMKLKEFLERQGDFPGMDFGMGTNQKQSDRMSESGSEYSVYRDKTSERQYRPSRAKDNQYNENINRNSGSRDRHDSSEHWYNEVPRSRRRNRRSSLNGRHSRDSSVSSVQSVQSYQGDEGEKMYHSLSLPRKGRRRRRSSNASLKDMSSSREALNNPENLSLKITFAQDHNEKRQVTMQGPSQGHQLGHGQGNQQVPGHQQGQKGQGHGPVPRGRGRGRARSAERSREKQGSGGRHDEYRGQTGQDKDFHDRVGVGRGQDRRSVGRGQDIRGSRGLGQDARVGGRDNRSHDMRGHGHDARGQGQDIRGHDTRGQGQDMRHPSSRGHDTRSHGKDRHDRRERRHSGRDEHMHEAGTSPRGGLLKLPSGALHTETQNLRDEGKSHSRKNVGPQAHPGSSGNSARGGAGQRRLFDPNNPNKPIMIQDGNKSQNYQEESKPLQFQDVGHDNPTTPTSPRGQQPPFHQGYPQWDPAAPYFQNYDPRLVDTGHGFPQRHPGPHPVPLPGHPGQPGGYYYPYPVPYRDMAMYPEEMYHRDPYYQGGEFEQDLAISGRSRTQCRAIAERMIQESLSLDSQLSDLVARRLSSKDFTTLTQIRQDLQSKCEQVILLDLDVANKHNTEQLLWKSVYYQVIEVFRKILSEEKDEETKTQLTQILNQGTEFYERLLQKLQQTFNFQLEAFLDTSVLPPDNISRTVKLALLSTQRTLICLGDIARYREQSSDTGKVNYGRARNWYSKAQQIAPKNGRPYNQLAILALYTRRKLDAVYYYMRSLAASNPFLTARESLISLFDEARKKAQNSEKRREQEKEKVQRLRQQKRQQGERIEIWVSADGTSTENNGDEGTDLDLSKLDAVELNKRFVLSFLNVHGKLFTKVGRETFPECCAQMLKEFDALLRRGAIGPTRLLQLMAINMFAIDNTALKTPLSPSDPGSELLRSELQEQAVQLGLDMFGILVRRCSEQLKEHLVSNDYPAHMFSRELEEQVPGIKVWTDWMYCNPTLWNPPPNIHEFTLGPDVDVWQSCADLCNILRDVDTSHVKLYKEKKEGCDPVILHEDNMLAGFVPLLSLPIKFQYVHSTVTKEIAQDCCRIEKLQDFGDYLCGIPTPMLSFDVERKQYYSVAPPTGFSDDEKDEEKLEAHLSGEEDVIVESESEEITGEDDEHIRHLREKKEELKRIKEEQRKQKETFQKIVDKNRHHLIELEIHPIFLVPDTNCFIDHLSSIQKLIHHQKYTVTIPLIVINELDGLAKGSRMGQYDSQEHANKVKKSAEETIRYLEAEFQKKNNHLRAQTSKGNIMETISFRSEETETDSGNNDDLILSCCLHYCKDKARDFMTKDKDAPIRLFRDVVLLTDDRNLRLKAHTYNVPVKDVPSFIQWSKVT
ncbi:LOW QUALITY PROTEIN: telomerase-binding protein EST1A-like [Pecten maximus]|uniref:LOW QUALITY PROTEIN: telomerase-binding protein EST1A-like n=1 Tax=Pecten maximus TaxID=6579 RepID=UPI001458B42E|nr:LOW QUALITY PROTEIN: telomerase-binding protein EST1A-like [Pecten maximus]